MPYTKEELENNEFYQALSNSARDEYEAENQRQIIQSLDTVKTQLNTTYQVDLKNEEQAFNFFIS